MNGVRQLLARFTGDQAMFIVANAMVNLLLLGRSYLAMRTLDYAQLGLFALLQSIILLIGALQLGILNGGFRLLCSKDRESCRRINDLVYTCIGILAAASILVTVALVWFIDSAGLRWITVLGIAAGILTIVRNWMWNQVVASGGLRSLNTVSMVSAFVSMVPLLFIDRDPLLACVASVGLQPLIFALYLHLRDTTLRPSGVLLSLALLRETFVSGFVVFLTSVLLLVNTQIERWTIVSWLGLDALGRFYLALLFLTLYGLVPSSLDAIFLPRVVKSHVAGDYERTRAELRTFLAITTLYSVVVVIVVLLFARPLLGWLLPQYVADLPYVYLVIPGAVVFNLVTPFAMTFNILIKYRFYFYSYGFGTLATAVLLGAWALVGERFDLQSISIIRSVVCVLMAAVILIGYHTLCRAHVELRFHWPRNPAQVLP